MENSNIFSHSSELNKKDLRLSAIVKLVAISLIALFIVSCSSYKETCSAYSSTYNYKKVSYEK
jgi:hypothetical protein